MKSEASIVRAADGEPAAGADWIFKATSDSTSGMFDFMVGPVRYLSGPPLHVHDEQVDTFYVLEGTLAVQLHDEIHELHEGDFVSIPPGVPHTFDNLHEGATVRAINVMTPGGMNVLFADLARARASGDQDAARAAARRGGVTTVGPTLGERLGLNGTTALPTGKAANR